MKKTNFFIKISTMIVFCSQNLVYSSSLISAIDFSHEDIHFV